MTFLRRPIPESYWVQPGLLAGEYPGARDERVARRKVQRLLDAGVTLFLDLTEAGEYRLKPYWPFVEAAMAQRGIAVRHQRFPIRDMGVPTVAAMEQTLAAINAGIDAGYVVYVHCWGGIGRTGTVIGCHLVQHGLNGDAALATLAWLRRGTPDSGRPSPETDAQREFVRTWYVQTGG